MPNILIVGAGPTGLTLACELAARGVSHRLVDAADGPFPGSRAKGVQPRTLEVFDHLGIVDEIVAAGSAELPFRQYAEDGRHRDVPRPGLGARPDVPWPSPVLIPQWRTEAALRGRLEALGGRVEYGTALTALDARADGVHASLQQAGETRQVEADWLVGCDGGRSAVRHALDLHFVGETHEDMRMLVGDMQVEGLDREHWHTWRNARGFLAMAPLPGTQAFQVQVAIGPNGPDTPTLQTFQRLVEQHTGRSDIRLSAPSWTSLWRANVRMVEHYRSGRAFVAGDAAHVHTPAGGQGMNTGIQDAFNLGWKLAAVARGAADDLLDSYEAERLPVARNVLALSTRLAASAMAPSTGGLVARDEETFQLGIHYRASPLSRELRQSPGRVQAGDRAPDAPGLVDGDGAARRLFDVFRGPHATLVAFGAGWEPVIAEVLAQASDALRAVCIEAAGAAPGSTALPRLVDAQGHAHAAWEPGEGALFLVRPDGMVGVAAADRQAGPFLDWLAATGSRRR